MNPRVSVVVATYQHALFVGETIRSVLDQSFQDFEIVIVNDGSRDGTSEVIHGFSDPRINMEVFPENRGPSIAWNSAIRQSRGEFICVLDSDDYFLPGKLEKQIAFLDANPLIAAVFGQPRIIDEEGKPISSDTREYILPPFGAPAVNRTPSRCDWLRHFFFRGNCLCQSTMMIRRSAHSEVGPYDARLLNLGDFDMWVRLCMGHEIHVMPESLTAYRVLKRNRNMSAPRVDTILRSNFEYSEILKHYLAMAPELARKVFAVDLAENGIDPENPMELWLAELALAANGFPQRLFALETMFRALPQTGGDVRHYWRLIELTGTQDVFGLDVRSQLEGYTKSRIHRFASVIQRTWQRLGMR